ncbi:MAG: hypothetical protein GY873_30860 [Bosea sp.]|uniref:hypothetical protein n=1 Tax=Bosea sp. (in: a-proteobacteria) TaxID=1871050 RepID=UPI00238B3306|nr:hypothetical protein [Bosea sp. (in: a-proteobacteria)]
MIENYIGKLDDAEYRARQRGDTPAIGGSGLVLIERNSPAHHVANQASMRESKPGAFGSLVHCLVLEPETFAARYYVRPDVVERESVPEPRRVKAAAGPTPYKEDTADGERSRGWTVDGVEFYKTKKALLEAAAESNSGEPSGWTVDGVEFFKTKKALLEQSDACHRWALVGAVESGPWYRTRDDAAAACVELAGGREVVSLADFARAGDAVDALTAHPVAGALLNACDAFELSVLWHDVQNGVDCSGQLDAYAANTDGIDLPGVCIEPGRRVGIDLKTTGRLVTPGTESRIVLDGGHHIQAAHYMDGCEANGKPLDAWIMIYVETKAPFGVRVVQLGETFLALGRYRRGLALAKVAAWNALPADADPPSYEPACVTVEPPARAVPDVVGDADWSDWMESSKTSAREAAIQAARDEHAAAEDDTSRIEGALTALFDGRAQMARRAVELANDGEYSAALAASDGMIGVDDKIAALRHEHATAEIRTAKAWAALQGVRNG